MRAPRRKRDSSSDEEYVGKFSLAEASPDDALTKRQRVVAGDNRDADAAELWLQSSAADAASEHSDGDIQLDPLHLAQELAHCACEFESVERRLGHSNQNIPDTSTGRLDFSKLNKRKFRGLCKNLLRQSRRLVAILSGTPSVPGEPEACSI